MWLYLTPGRWGSHLGLVDDGRNREFTRFTGEPPQQARHIRIGNEQNGVKHFGVCELLRPLLFKDGLK